MWGRSDVTRIEVCDIAENDRTGDAGAGTGVYSLLILESVLPYSSFPFARRLLALGKQFRS